ncbi:Glycine betaine transport ATP-binding protein OpuAA [compost metagenome]
MPEDSQWDEAGCKTINELTRFVSRWYPDWSEAVYRNLLNRYELEGKMKLATLSKGMQRKLAFIHAMSFDPDLLLMDESTSGLDPFAWRLMMDDIVQYMDRGSKTVIFATHILDEVKRLADYVAFMYEGQLIGFYEKDTLMDSWKIFWVESNEQQASAISGVVAVEAKSGASSVRIISQAPAETEAALQRQGIRMLNTQAVELDEILAHLIRQNRIGTMK